MTIKTFTHHHYTFFNHYRIIILGLFMFTIFIFFRQRLPRDIPFNLMPLGFVILIYVCCIFAFIVWTLLRPYKKANETVTSIIKYLFEPLDAFDNFIKQIPFIQIYYPKVLGWIADKGLYVFQKPLFEIIFFFIPRICLLLVFIIDIFYFSKLYYIYYVLVPSGLLLFFRRYFIYSIDKLKIQYIELLKLDIKGIDTDYEFGIHPSELEPDYNPNDPDNSDIPPSMTLEVDIFVDYYCRCKMYRNEEPSIKFLWQTKFFYDKYETKADVARLEKLKLKKNIKDCSMLSLLHATIFNTSNNNFYFKRVKIIIYSLYFITWVYILIVSFHTLNLLDFITFVNSTWLTYCEPFSEIELYPIKQASYSKIMEFLDFKFKRTSIKYE